MWDYPDVVDGTCNGFDQIVEDQNIDGESRVLQGHQNDTELVRYVLGPWGIYINRGRVRKQIDAPLHHPPLQRHSIMTYEDL
jgi:hypothetical protein